MFTYSHQDAGVPSPGCEICSPSEGEKAPLADPAPPHDTPAAQPLTAHTDGTMDTFSLEY